MRLWLALVRPIPFLLLAMTRFLTGVGCPFCIGEQCGRDHDGQRARSDDSRAECASCKGAPLSLMCSFLLHLRSAPVGFAQVKAATKAKAPVHYACTGVATNRDEGWAKCAVARPVLGEGAGGLPAHYTQCECDYPAPCSSPLTAPGCCRPQAPRSEVPGPAAKIVLLRRAGSSPVRPAR